MKSKRIAYITVGFFAIKLVIATMLLGRYSNPYKYYWLALSKSLTHLLCISWMLMFLTWAKPLQICDKRFLYTIILFSTVLALLDLLTMLEIDGRQLIYFLSCVCSIVVILYFYICHNKGNFKC